VTSYGKQTHAILKTAALANRSPQWLKIHAAAVAAATVKRQASSVVAAAAFAAFTATPSVFLRTFQ